MILNNEVIHPIINQIIERTQILDIEYLIQISSFTEYNLQQSLDLLL